MIVETWTIASEHLGRRWWRVQVHDSAGTLQLAALKFRPRDAPWDKAIGCCHPVRPWILQDDDPDNPAGPVEWPRGGYAGLIRLSAEHLYPEVIYHELLHAACSVYRMNVALSIELGNGHVDIAREEDLAYIYGQLAADMADALVKRVAA